MTYHFRNLIIVLIIWFAVLGGCIVMGLFAVLTHDSGQQKYAGKPKPSLKEVRR